MELGVAQLMAVPPTVAQAQPDGAFSANYTSVQLAFGQRVRVARSSLSDAFAGLLRPFCHLTL